MRCPRESYLTLRGEEQSDSFFNEIHRSIAAAYKARAKQNTRAKLKSAELVEFKQYRKNLAIMLPPA